MSGLGPASNSCSPPKRGRENEAAGAVGGEASRRISAAPPAGGPLAAGDHERERQRRSPDPGGRYASCASAVAWVGRITPGRDDRTR
jgi:hypothetical protein